MIHQDSMTKVKYHVIQELIGHKRTLIPSLFIIKSYILVQM